MNDREMARLLFVAVAAVASAGCTPWQPAGIAAYQASAREEAVDVAVGLSFARSGPPGREPNRAGGADISTLLVGLFDEGSTPVPGFGSKYTAAFGTSPTSARVAPIAGSSWIRDLEARMDAETTSDHRCHRRYMLREYTSRFSATGSLAVAFRQVPTAPGHRYRTWAAAYDDAGRNLGFVTAPLVAPHAAPGRAAASLTLPPVRDTGSPGQQHAATANLRLQAL